MSVGAIRAMMVRIGFALAPSITARSRMAAAATHSQRGILRRRRHDGRAAGCAVGLGAGACRWPTRFDFLGVAREVLGLRLAGGVATAPAGGLGRGAGSAFAMLARRKPAS